MAPNSKQERFTVEDIGKLYELLKDPDAKARIEALDNLDRRIAASEQRLRKRESEFYSRLVDEWQGLVIAIVGLGCDWAKIALLYISMYLFEALAQSLPLTGWPAKALHGLHDWAVVGVAALFIVISFSTILKTAGILKRRREP